MTLAMKAFETFQAQHQFHVEFSKYTIRVAQNWQELEECFRLRNEVFNKEFRDVHDFEYEVDSYDKNFDHLIIIHNETRKIVGTYRLLCVTDLQQSYVKDEFHISPLFQNYGKVLELGRACIAKEHRKGSVVSLLWRGIAEYMKLTQADILMGCSSIKITNARDAALVHKYLVDKNYVASLECAPTEKYSFKDLNCWLSYLSTPLNEMQNKEAYDYLPSLLKTYLKLGAKIYAEPAYDEDFECIDILTVLKSSDIVGSAAERYTT